MPFEFQAGLFANPAETPPFGHRRSAGVHGEHAKPSLIHLLSAFQPLAQPRAFLADPSLSIFERATFPEPIRFAIGIVEKILKFPGEFVLFAMSVAKTLIAGGSLRPEHLDPLPSVRAEIVPPAIGRAEIVARLR